MNVSRYSKFITSLIGMFVVYVQLYGMHWVTVPAITGIAAALGVLGVPNAEAPGRQGPLVADQGQMVAAFTAAVDDLLAKRLVRIPKPVPAQVPPAASTVAAGAPTMAAAAVLPPPEPIPEGSQP